jgi:hypothetical protein
MTDEEQRKMNERPTTPEAWLEKYNRALDAGRGLTAREWDHYGELERTISRSRPKRGAS